MAPWRIHRFCIQSTFPHVSQWIRGGLQWWWDWVSVSRRCHVTSVTWQECHLSGIAHPHYEYTGLNQTRVILEPSEGKRTVKPLCSEIIVGLEAEKVLPWPVGCSFYLTCLRGRMVTRTRENEPRVFLTCRHFPAEGILPMLLLTNISFADSHLSCRTAAWFFRLSPGACIDSET